MPASLCTARVLLLALLGLVGACWCASAAQAQAYKGTTAQWATLELTIADAQVTAFTTGTGRLQTCEGVPTSDTNTDPVAVRYAGAPVPVVGGAFHLDGTTEGPWGEPFTFTVDGTVSVDGRIVSGTITAGGDTRMRRACTGTWQFEAIVPPRVVRTPRHRDFESTGRGRVSFDYVRGTITHLTADIGVSCPGGSWFGAQIDTTAYGLDPIRVRKDGTFRIEGAVLDDYDVVHHYVLTGRVRGARATGAVQSYRLDDEGNKDGVGVVKCAMGHAWRSSAPRVLPPTPTAYFDVAPYRYGRPGAWTYYLQVSISGCFDATRASVGVAGGPRTTVACRGHVRLGPLRPMRTYRVLVTALRLQRGRVVARAASPEASVYLPGDDGDWVRIRP